MSVFVVLVWYRSYRIYNTITKFFDFYRVKILANLNLEFRISAIFSVIHYQIGFGREIVETTWFNDRTIIVIEF